MPSFSLPPTATSTPPSPAAAEFSYAAAAKTLQTSTRAVCERLAVAEELLDRRHLTPPPDALVLQHVTYAVTCAKADFDAYRPRYWHLLARLLRRSRHPVAAALPSAALRALSADPEPPLRDAVAQALSAMCEADGALPGDLELLAKLAGAALRHSLPRIALCLLVSFDDAVRLCGASRCFGAAMHILWPLCAAQGTVRAAGDIAARNALFAVPSSVLNDESHFEALYQMLADVRKLPQRRLLLLPECAALLMRTCRQSAHGRGQHFAAPRKRPFDAIDSTQPTAAPPKAGDHAKSALPIEYAVPARFLRNVLHALTRNDGKEDVHWVRAVAKLLDTACELRVFRLEYDQVLARQDAESKAKKMANKKPVLERPSVRELLERVVQTAVKALPMATPEDVPHWADCGRAVVAIAEDIIEDHLRMLLKAVLECAEKHASRANVRDSLAEVLHALIKVYQSTRKMPTLFHMLVELREELDGASSLLAVARLQKAFVACARSLPRGQAAKCVGECLQASTSGAICFILSLFIESIDFDELCAVLPLIAEMLNGADVNRPHVLHLYSSVVVACARYSLPTSHQVVQKLDFALVEKKTRMKKQCESMAAQVARLSFLAAWTLLQIGEVGDQVSVSASLSGYAFLECMGGLPRVGVEEGDSGWKLLVAGDSGNWTRPVLRAVAAMTPVVDSVEQGLAQIDANADEGVRAMVRWAVLHVRGDDGFWDGLLEMRFAKRVVGSVLLDEIVRTGAGIDAEDYEHTLRIVTKLSVTLLDASQRSALLSGCQRIRGSVSAVCVEALQAAEEALRCQVNDVADEGKEWDIDEQVLDELNDFVASESTRIATRRKGSKSDVDAPVEEKAEEGAQGEQVVLKLLHQLQRVGSVERTVIRHRPVLSLTAVVIGDSVLFGNASRRGLGLQVLSALAVDDANAGVGGLFDLLLRRVAAKKASLQVQWLERLCALSCALTCGRMGMSDVGDWTASRIVGAVLQAARLKAPAAPNLRTVTLLRHCVIAVAGALWRARQGCRREDADSSARGRALAFEAVEVRRREAAVAWRAALFPLAACALAANGSLAAEWCEVLVSAIAQLLAADAGSDQHGDRARMHYAAMRAVSLLAKRSTLVLAALRCIRITLRSGCCDEETARVVARFYQRVSGPATVAALVDLAVALVSVGDGGVRAAMEHGAAALISRLDERGLNEALRACSDEARLVLRALVDTYRSDFEYERR